MNQVRFGQHKLLKVVVFFLVAFFFLWIIEFEGGRFPL
jgi:uncharacterized membrane protein